MSPPDIFLSYNREDQAVAKRFAEAFEADGLSVWWDVTLRSGEAYDQVTEDALRSAKAVVVLWSRRSVESRWVRAEATLADRNRTLIPARIEACDLPIMFELTQTADLSHWQGEGRDKAWQAFLEDVRKLVATKAEPQPAGSQTSASLPVRGNKPSIAVLPFINRSGLSDDDVFADGMVEDLTAALSLSRRIKIIAASATAAYRTGARDLRQIGRELGVRYLLEGNVRRVGQDFRVTAQLVEADDGNILWTQKFDKPLSDIATLQEELVTDVAACLGVEVQRAEMEHALRKPGNITAWEAVLRADSNMARQSPSGYEAALTEAKRAVEIDPDYDLAQATLALTFGLVHLSRGAADSELEREAANAVAKARTLDTNEPIALARIAAALSCLGRHREALPIAERAVDANPNLDNPRISLGNILCKLGRWEEALVQWETVERIAPNGIWRSGTLFWIGIAHFQAGQVAESLELTERSLRLRAYLPARLHRAVCLASLNRWGEARLVVREIGDEHTDLSFAFAESLLRNADYKGMDEARIDDYVAVLRRLWETTAGSG
jgi:TolB-like protein